MSGIRQTGVPAVHWNELLVLYHDLVVLIRFGAKHGRRDEVEELEASK
jgi:hypothetical protein